MTKNILLLAAVLGFVAQSSVFAADPTPAPSASPKATTHHHKHHKKAASPAPSPSATPKDTVYAVPIRLPGQRPG